MNVERKDYRLRKSNEIRTEIEKQEIKEKSLHSCLINCAVCRSD
jgi:hypothetical protein